MVRQDSHALANAKRPCDSSVLLAQPDHAHAVVEAPAGIVTEDLAHRRTREATAAGILGQSERPCIDYTVIPPWL